MKLIRVTLLLMATALMAGSCIDTNVDNCAGNVVLSFSYKGDDGVEKFAAKINSVDVFIFDKSHDLVIHETVDQASLNISPSVEVDLMPGTYTVVCWGNSGSHGELSVLSKGDNHSQGYVQICKAQGGVIANGDPLYYAPFNNADTFTLEVPAADAVSETIEFRSAHAKLIVETIGFVGNQEPEVEIINTESKYDFGMQAAGMVVDYKGVTELINAADKHYKVTFNTARIAADTPIQINLRHADGAKQIVETVILKDALASDATIDLTKQELVIKVTIEFVNGNCTVTLAGWDEEEVEPAG